MASRISDIWSLPIGSGKVHYIERKLAYKSADMLHTILYKTLYRMCVRYSLHVLGVIHITIFS